MQVLSKTDIGLVRKTNQDCVKSISSNEFCFSIVCDGIGGISGGDIASKTASSIICDYFDNNKISDIKKMFFDSFKIANDKILEIGKNDKKINNLGTTAVALFLDESKNAYICNVGDSRAYVISDSNIKQITNDHSMVNELLMSKQITNEEAEKFPNKNIITRALGGFNSTPDVYSFKLNSNEKILLCTDGLSNYLSNEEILNIITNNDSQKSLDILIDSAKNLGGNDNITVSLIF